MVDGNQNRTLTIVKAANDGATNYQIATDYVPANGSFNEVAVINSGNNLNTTVTQVAHWVRSRNATGESGWLRCDSYRKISFVDVVDLEDDRRTTANVAMGLDGNGSSPIGTENTVDYRVFTGTDDDIVVVDARNTAGMAPDGKKMAYRIKFRISATELAFLQSAGNNGTDDVSWNLMQRGLADDPGGQWKMSLVSQTNSSAVRIQCVTQTGPGPSNRHQIDSGFDVSNMTLVNGYTPWITATCFVDDSGQSQGPNGITGDGLQVVVNGQSSPEDVTADTGNILPSGLQICGSGTGTPLNLSLFPDKLGSVVTVGNKPPCSTSNDSDDAFIGQVAYAEVFKQ